MVNKKAWSKEEIDYILQNYENMSWQEIAKELNRTPNSVQMKVKRLGLKKYPYYCDKDFFHNIDTEEKAYWLGFIVADGWVAYGKNNSGELGIELKLSDIEHLKKFNKSINGNYKINIRERKSPFKEDATIKMCGIRIYSIQIVNDLCNFGVIPHKTHQIKLADLNENLMPHFIRGYFDGDGSIYIRHKKQRQIGMKFTSGCKSFIEDLRQCLFNQSINSYIMYQESYCDLIIGGMANVDRLLDYMYTDATVYLDRKLQKAIRLYKEFKIEQRLPRHSEMSGFYKNWERILEG